MIATPASVPASGAKNSTLQSVAFTLADHGIHAIQALVKNKRFPITASEIPTTIRVLAFIPLF